MKLSKLSHGFLKSNFVARHRTCLNEMQIKNDAVMLLIVTAAYESTREVWKVRTEVFCCGDER